MLPRRVSEDMRTYLLKRDQGSLGRRRRDSEMDMLALADEVGVWNKGKDTDRSAHESADKSGPFALEPEPATV